MYDIFLFFHIMPTDNSLKICYSSFICVYLLAQSKYTYCTRKPEDIVDILKIISRKILTESTESTFSPFFGISISQNHREKIEDESEISY